MKKRLMVPDSLIRGAAKAFAETPGIPVEGKAEVLIVAAPTESNASMLERTRLSERRAVLLRVAAELTAAATGGAWDPASRGRLLDFANHYEREAAEVK